MLEGPRARSGSLNVGCFVSLATLSHTHTFTLRLCTLVRVSPQEKYAESAVDEVLKQSGEDICLTLSLNPGAKRLGGVERLSVSLGSNSAGVPRP